MSHWYYLVGEAQHGPVEEPTLRALFETDQLPPETFVWKEGLANWLPATQVPELIPPPDTPVPFIQPAADARAAAAVQAHPLAAEEPAAAPSGAPCAECGARPVVPGFPTPLCETCRGKFTRLNVPVWLKAVAVLLVILIVVAMFRLPSELGAAVAIRHGDEAEAKGDHSAALAFYQKALATYPNSEDALCGAAVSAIRSGDKEAAVDYVRRFAAKGDSVSKTNVARLNAALGGKS